MPTKYHSKTVRSLTALICVVVNIVCCLLYLLHMNHYAVMIVYFGNQCNYEEYPFCLSVF